METSGRRYIQLSNSLWKFLKADPEQAASPLYDDADWQTVAVPHDWAITGLFDKDHDLQQIRIVEDGEKMMSHHTGRTAGLAHVGVGWYRKRFSLSKSDEGQQVFVEFDGVMSHSSVYLNGKPIGAWPYGYTSFCFELTGHVKFGEENVLAVRVDNKPCASRWYPGAGIYRHVRLVIVHPVHVAHWGTYVSTPDIADFEATVRIRTTVQNQSGEEQELELATTILDPTGNQVAASSVQQHIATAFEFDQTLRIPQPVRWDIDEPKLYQAVSTLSANGIMVDRYETSFGIRELRFDANEGFFLNGRNLKFKGVCMHHDLGALGAAMNRRALERQLEMLQEMGCNAIRSSHNPPAPELLELCDTMGFLVIDEAFDEWKIPKVDHGYHTLFDEWAEKDLRAMIKRDRNHPCIIMWSIGNEIGEQRSETGAEVARFLTDIAHDEDPTRPVTAGFNESDAAIKNGLADVVDIPGWNYKPHRYQQYHQQHPEWLQYGSETESTVSSRGAYYFPVEREIGVRRDTLHVSSYDLSSPMWAYPPDVEFAAQDECPFIMGEFAWTGWDYLGEPTPYKEEWPSRSAYFGSLDLCGIPKDRFYLYRSQWRTDIPTLHLLPHWNWKGREGEVTPVHCYTSYDSAELFLNGRSLGKRTKDQTVSYRKGGKPPWYGGEYTPVQRYRLIWEDVRYEPGILKVVAFDQDGKPAAQEELRTAGAPANITLSPDRRAINADGTDLSFVTVKITDVAGNLCPLADNLVTFKLDGPGRIVAVDNGDQTSLEPFAAKSRKAFHGMCMLIVSAEKAASGEIRITASSQGLRSGITSVGCE